MSHVYPVRDLINASFEVVKSLPSPHVILFEDGVELACKRNATIYSHVFWRLIREYPNTKVTSKHHVTTIMGTKGYNSGTHRQLLSALFESVVKDNQLYLPRQKEHPLAVMQEIIAEVSYVIPQMAEASVISIDILDFIETANHPDIDKFKQIAVQDPRKIRYAYNEAIDIIKKDPSLSKNGLGKALKAGMVNENQVLQCTVFRGFCTEVDGEIFPEPVWANYTKGNVKLSYLAADSRTAAKSYLYSETPLQDSEYMSRQFHFFVTAVERIEWEDCGNTKVLPWQIRPPTVDQDGVMTFKGDLAYMTGKWYKENAGEAEFKVIKGNEDYLHGKTIFIRSAVHCRPKDPHAICHCCAGDLAHNISRFANIGHLCSTTLTAILSQNILSYKHVNTSSTMAAIVLDETARLYLNSGHKQEEIYVSERIKANNPKIHVLRNEAQGLVDLLHVVDIDDINPSRISNVTQIKIHTTKGGRSSEAAINVSQRGLGVLLSEGFLRYLKKVGWKTTSTETFEFDLSGWDFSKPILEQPTREYSFVDLSSQVSATIKSKQKDVSSRQSHNSPVALLQEIFDQVNAKLNVNILCFEVIVRGLMVASKTSYEMAYGVEHPVLGLVDQLNKNRSLGPAMAFEGQNDVLTSPASFFMGHRPDSILDVFICPREVTEQYKGRHKDMDAGLATTFKAKAHLVGKTSSSGLW